LNVGFSWAFIDRIPNLFDPIQSNSLQKTSENWRFRGFHFAWMKIEVKRNQE
jgi:hypothetical protein